MRYAIDVRYGGSYHSWHEEQCVSINDVKAFGEAGTLKIVEGQGFAGSAEERVAEIAEAVRPISLTVAELRSVVLLKSKVDLAISELAEAGRAHQEGADTFRIVVGDEQDQGHPLSRAAAIAESAGSLLVGDVSVTDDLRVIQDTLTTFGNAVEDLFNVAQTLSSQVQTAKYNFGEPAELGQGAIDITTTFLKVL